MVEGNENDEVSLKELLDKGKEWYIYLVSKWKIIVLVGLIGSALGLITSFIIKPKYTATLTFALEEESGGGGLGGALGLASSFGFDIGGGGGSIFTESNLIELFKSRSMVEKTLLTSTLYKSKSITFAEMYIQNNDLREKWENKPKLKNIQFLPNAKREKFTREQDSILGAIYENLSKSGLTVVKKDKKIDIITIDLVTESEEFSKKFTEALAKEVSDFYVDTKSKKARINMEILKRQTDSIRGMLNGSITSVAAATDNTFNLNPALVVKRAPVARKQVDVQANTAILTELVKQSELAKIALRKETPLIQIIDTPIYPLKKEKFGKLKGLVLGGILFGFFMVLGLVFKKIID
jgi:uncharacterized protein involved in exopolysaccharide biosynthesis